MNPIYVSFSYWERKARNGVTHTVKKFTDGNRRIDRCKVLTPWYEVDTGTPEYSMWRYKPSQWFFMDLLAYCPTGLLCILASKDSVRLAVHALDAVATLSRSCQPKHGFKITNFTTMQYMQIVNFAASYWKHFLSSHLI